MKKLIILSFLLILSAEARVFENQDKIDEYFSILSKENTDFNPDGAVCERVASIEVEKIYPQANFKIVNGIQYDDRKSTVGELDLVVFNKLTGIVEAIGEVKCWKSFEGGLKKAHEQQKRFKLFLEREIYISDFENNKYTKEQFKHVTNYFTISQLGGASYGFDFELSLELKEFIELRRLLLNCASENRCPTP